MPNATDNGRDSESRTNVAQMSPPKKKDTTRTRQTKRLITRCAWLELRLASWSFTNLYSVKVLGRAAGVSQAVPRAYAFFFSFFFGVDRPAPTHEYQ